MCRNSCGGLFGTGSHTGWGSRIRVTGIYSLLYRPQAFAGGAVSNSTVTEIRVDSNGHGMIYFSANLSGGSACGQSGNFKNTLAFDATTMGGSADAAIGPQCP